MDNPYRIRQNVPQRTLVTLLNNALRLVETPQLQSKLNRLSRRVPSSLKLVPSNMHRVVRMETPSRCNRVHSRCRLAQIR